MPSDSGPIAQIIPCHQSKPHFKKALAAMMTFNPIQQVAFDYISYQGRFRVTYFADRCAIVNSYGQARKAVKDDAEAVGFAADLAAGPVAQCAGDVTEETAEPEFKISPFSCHETWSHDLDVAADMAELSETELLAKYRSVFETHDIHRTCIEPQEKSALPRVDFSITLINGERMRGYLRSDGVGYLISPLEWVDWPGVQPGAGPQGVHERLRRFSEKVTIVGFHAHDPFLHGVDCARIVRDAAAAALDPSAATALAQTYEDLFWSDINPTLEAPWVRTPHELDSSAMSFENGDACMMTQLMTWAAWLDADVWNGLSDSFPGLVLLAKTGLDGTHAFIDREEADNFRFSDRIITLIDTALRWSRPTGYAFNYDDGPSGNWCAYSKDRQDICVTVVAPTATERMEALDGLLTWSDAAGIDIACHVPA